MGVDFTIVEGKGPKIISPIRSKTDIDAIRPLHDVGSQVPFLSTILKVRQNSLLFLPFLRLGRSSF